MIVVPGSLLRFKDERLEGTWVELFNRSVSAQDMTWTLMSWCMNLAGAHKLLASGSPAPALLLWAAAAHLVLDGIATYMHLRHPTVFVRRRDFMVAALRLTRMSEPPAVLPADLPGHAGLAQSWPRAVCRHFCRYVS